MILSARVHFSHSRLSTVIDRNRKRVCDFILVCYSNLRPILHRFRYSDIADICAQDPPHSNIILGVFSYDHIVHFGVNLSSYLKLFGHKIIFEVFQPV